VCVGERIRKVDSQRGTYLGFIRLRDCASRLSQFNHFHNHFGIRLAPVIKNSIIRGKTSNPVFDI